MNFKCFNNASNIIIRNFCFFFLIFAVENLKQFDVFELVSKLSFYISITLTYLILCKELLIGVVLNLCLIEKNDISLLRKINFIYKYFLKYIQRNRNSFK